MKKTTEIITLIIFAVVILGAVRKCYIDIGSPNYSEECFNRWLYIRKPIGILSYEKETGLPIYKFPKMPREFYRQCKKELKFKHRNK